jgi:hypothetical protein
VERVGADGDEQKPDDGGAGEQRAVAMRREVDGEHDRPQRPCAEAGEPLPPPRRDEECGKAQAGDDTGDLRAHFVTTTAARATCPRVATRST